MTSIPLGNGRVVLEIIAWCKSHGRCPDCGGDELTHMSDGCSGIRGRFKLRSRTVAVRWSDIPEVEGSSPSSSTKA